jgi:hypothetical protein
MENSNSKKKSNDVKIEGGRTIPVPSNSVKPKILIKPKDKK